MAAEGRNNSGSGSDSVVSAPYARIVCDYMLANNVRRIVDIGCGDFRVGKRLLSSFF